MNRTSLSKLRAAAGKSGAVARWGKRPKTKTIRVFEGDADKLDSLAVKRRKRVADIVHSMMSRPV